MTLELVTVKTADDIELDGALYLPDGDPAEWREPIFAVHGLTWNFYRGPMRWLPKFFIAAGYPCLSLNMRDHDLDQPKDFELSHHDLSAGIDFLIGKFGKTPTIVGHGYANNKIACYAGAIRRRPDRLLRPNDARLGQEISPRYLGHGARKRRPHARKSTGGAGRNRRIDRG